MLGTKYTSVLLFFNTEVQRAEEQHHGLNEKTNKFKYLLREKDEVEEEADRSGSHSSLGS